MWLRHMHTRVLRELEVAAHQGELELTSTERAPTHRPSYARDGHCTPPACAMHTADRKVGGSLAAHQA